MIFCLQFIHPKFPPNSSHIPLHNILGKVRTNNITDYIRLPIKNLIFNISKSIFTNGEKLGKSVVFLSLITLSWWGIALETTTFKKLIKTVPFAPIFEFDLKWVRASNCTLNQTLKSPRSCDFCCRWRRLALVSKTHSNHLIDHLVFFPEVTEMSSHSAIAAPLSRFSWGLAFVVTLGAACSVLFLVLLPPLEFFFVCLHVFAMATKEEIEVSSSNPRSRF